MCDIATVITPGIHEFNLNDASKEHIRLLNIEFSDMTEILNVARQLLNTGIDKTQLCQMRMSPAEDETS